MLSLESLTKVSNGLKATVAGMRNANTALNTKIDKLTADNTRSQGYIAEQIKAERDNALPGLLKDLASMRDVATKVASHREFWANRSLLLSRIPFDSNPAVNAQISMNLRDGLAAMDQPLLALTQQNALADGNLALVWACVMASRAAGYGALSDLSAVTIPDQVEALALIDGCDASLAEAEMIVAGASGLSMDPVRKLTFGRRMQPNAPTQHNSPGRSAA